MATLLGFVADVFGTRPQKPVWPHCLGPTESADYNSALENTLAGLRSWGYVCAEADVRVF